MSYAERANKTLYIDIVALDAITRRLAEKLSKVKIDLHYFDEKHTLKELGKISDLSCALTIQALPKAEKYEAHGDCMVIPWQYKLIDPISFRLLSTNLAKDLLRHCPDEEFKKKFNKCFASRDKRKMYSLARKILSMIIASFQYLTLNRHLNRDSLPNYFR
jgi:hypothetical protein